MCKDWAVTSHSCNTLWSYMDSKYLVYTNTCLDLPITGMNEIMLFVLMTSQTVCWSILSHCPLCNMLSTWRLCKLMLCAMLCDTFYGNYIPDVIKFTGGCVLNVPKNKSCCENWRFDDFLFFTVPNLDCYLSLKLFYK